MVATTLNGVLLTGTHASRPAANAVAKGTLYSCTTHSLVYQSDASSWSTWATLGAATTVATDPIWDAAGDLVVGTGADTAARLAIGAVGGRLSRINGAVSWNSGTSFPGSKATGDIYYRSDLNGEWYWDGTQWLSIAAFQMPFPLATDPPLSGTGVLHRMAMPGTLGGSDVFLAAVIGTYYVAGGSALSGSNKWVGTVSKAGGASSSSLGTFTIDSGASDQWLGLGTIVVSAAAVVGTYKALEINWVKTGTPGSLYANVILAFRTIAT